MPKAILTLYKSVPDNNGEEKRVLAGEVELSENGNAIIQTIVGPATIKAVDIQMSVEVTPGIDWPNPMPEHVWFLG